MFSYISLPFYSYAKHHLSNENSKYIKRLYILDLLIFIYISFRFLFIGYLMYQRFDTFYDFRQIDVIARFYWEVASQTDPFFPILVVIFALFHLVCETEVLRNNHQSLVMRYIYQAVVENRDYYKKCMFDSSTLLLLQKNKEIYFYKKFKNFFIKLFFIKMAIKLYCKIKAKLVIWNNFENINQKQFLTQKLSIMPHLSQNIKKKTIKTLIVADLIGYFIQIIYGMSLK